MLVEHFHRQRKYEDAYRYIQFMTTRKIDLHPFLRADIINEVYKEMGIAPSSNERVKGEEVSKNNGDDEEDEDAVGEELDEVKKLIGRAVLHIGK